MYAAFLLARVVFSAEKVEGGLGAASTAGIATSSRVGVGAEAGAGADVGLGTGVGMGLGIAPFAFVGASMGARDRFGFAAWMISDDLHTIWGY